MYFLSAFFLFSAVFALFGSAKPAFFGFNLSCWPINKFKFLFSIAGATERTGFLAYRKCKLINGSDGSGFNCRSAPCRPRQHGVCVMPLLIIEFQRCSHAFNFNSSSCSCGLEPGFLVGLLVV